MPNKTQCELARVMTNDAADDELINREYELLDQNTRAQAAVDIDELIKKHNMPIDKALKIMFNDFADVAEKYTISPATLFCVYMDFKSKN